MQRGGTLDEYCMQGISRSDRSIAQMLHGRACDMKFFNGQKHAEYIFHCLKDQVIDKTKQSNRYYYVLLCLAIVDLTVFFLFSLNPTYHFHVIAW